MVKHTQTVCSPFPKNCLIVFDHFEGLARKGLGWQKAQKRQTIWMRLYGNLGLVSCIITLPSFLVLTHEKTLKSKVFFANFQSWSNYCSVNF